MCRFHHYIINESKSASSSNSHQTWCDKLTSSSSIFPWSRNSFLQLRPYPSVFSLIILPWNILQSAVFLDTEVHLPFNPSISNFNLDIFVNFSTTPTTNDLIDTTCWKKIVTHVAKTHAIKIEKATIFKWFNKLTMSTIGRPQMISIYLVKIVHSNILKYLTNPRPNYIILSISLILTILFPCVSFLIFLLVRLYLHIIIEVLTLFNAYNYIYWLSPYS